MATHTDSRPSFEARASARAPQDDDHCLALSVLLLRLDAQFLCDLGDLRALALDGGREFGWASRIDGLCGRGKPCRYGRIRGGRHDAVGDFLAQSARHALGSE